MLRSRPNHRIPKDPGSKICSSAFEWVSSAPGIPEHCRIAFQVASHLGNGVELRLGLLDDALSEHLCFGAKRSKIHTSGKANVKETGTVHVRHGFTWIFKSPNSLEAWHSPAFAMTAATYNIQPFLVCDQ
eukprot:72135-Chlamydomonas_euryale.AAC.3